MSADLVCQLCGGQLFRNRSTAGVVSEIRVCKHCDTPCRATAICRLCRKATSAKND